MSDPTPLTRQEPLQTLPAFCAALVAALQPDGPAGERLRPALDAALAAECVLCGITLTGTELLAVGTPASEPPGDDPKTTRLRQGYCARKDCTSYFYRLRFTPHPDIDWARALAQAEVAKTDPREEVQVEAVALAAARRAVRWRLGGRLLAGLTVLALLWLLRQWYIGGTIPLLREPEHFTADPASYQHPPAR
jgi:hypothetical protein